MSALRRGGVPGLAKSGDRPSGDKPPRSPAVPVEGKTPGLWFEGPLQAGCPPEFTKPGPGSESAVNGVQIFFWGGVAGTNGGGEDFGPLGRARFP